MEIRETALNKQLAEKLIALSEAWEAEGSCHGYGKNTCADLAGRRIFLAEENDEITGYLFGCPVEAEKSDSVMQEGTKYFEVEEIYVKPEHRSRGVGSALFRFMEERLEPELKYIRLVAASKKYKAALSFYIEELGMEFWSALLFKKLG